MEHYGGIEDDHIPFLRKGMVLYLVLCGLPYLWISPSVSIYVATLEQIFRGAYYECAGEAVRNDVIFFLHATEATRQTLGGLGNILCGVIISLM